MPPRNRHVSPRAVIGLRQGSILPCALAIEAGLNILDAIIVMLTHPSLILSYMATKPSESTPASVTAVQWLGTQWLESAVVGGVRPDMIKGDGKSTDSVLHSRHGRGVQFLRRGIL
jgi:hypothetical protein